MKTFHLALVAPIAILAACSGGGGSEQMQAGEWTMTTAMTDIEIPGMPEEMVAQMRESMGDQTTTESRCMSEEEAANPMQGMFSNNEMGENCDFGDSTFEGGVINVAATCEAPSGQPGTATMTIEGTYTATTMEAEMSVNVEGGPMAMTMSGTMSGERTGDCAAEG